MPSAAAPLKRPERSASFASLTDVRQPQAKRQERALAEPQPGWGAGRDHAAPLLPLLGGESKVAFFRRLGARLRHDLFSVVHDFQKDGLYVYKRPVRSGQGTERGALLAAAGSVFHHAVLYMKRGDELSALEFGPANSMDITENMQSEAPAGPVLLRPAPRPDPACLPMLHVRVPTHGLEEGVVQQALAFAQAQPYHALRQNCICFADFMARVLTGGVVKACTLVFDLLAGTVPAADPPLLQLLALFQMSWHDVCDGGRLLRAFLQQHPGAALLPPPAAAGNAVGSILVEAAEAQACDSQAGAAVEAAAPLGAAAAAPAAGPNPLAALLASLLPQQPAAVASLVQPAMQPAIQPSDSSGSDDIHFGGVEPGASSAGASRAAASASVASNLASLASTGDSRTPQGGMRMLPTRRPRGHAASR